MKKINFRNNTLTITFKNIGGMISATLTAENGNEIWNVIASDVAVCMESIETLLSERPTYVAHKVA